MIKPFLERVPLEKFLLLWFLAAVMGSSLLWLHFGFTSRMIVPLAWLVLGTGMGLLWATTRPRWHKIHCAWCGTRLTAFSSRYDAGLKAWVMIYDCAKCGHRNEKPVGGKKT